MQITCTDLSFHYPDQAEQVFQHLSFTVSDSSRLGIIGPNGSGKSTLLGILTGRLQPSGGMLTCSRPAPRIACIEEDTGDDRLVLASALGAVDQHLATVWTALQKSDDDAAAEFAQLDGYATLAGVQRTLTDTGLPEELWAHPVSSLSVGERLWLRVAEALLSGAGILAFDEPTSHLDIEKRAALAARLQDLKQPYIVVSHDRHFLDLVCTQILELAHGKGRLYAGGYTEYMAAVRTGEEHDQDVYDVQTRKVQQLRKAIGKIKDQAGGIEKLAYKSSSGFFSHKAARMEQRAKAMRRQLERSLAEAQAAKPFIEKKRTFVLDGSARGGVLVSLERVTVRMGTRVLFRDLSMTVRGGEHWCILGPNGAGKSTLLSILLGQRTPDAGEVLRSPSIVTGFVPQQVMLSHGDDLPLDLVRRNGAAETADARLLLGTLGIEGDQVFQPVRLLSAGQQKRVFIAQLIMTKPDLLIIDELEGNLAIDAVTQLEAALLEFPGALVMVTHDAALAQTVGKDFITLDGQGGWAPENRYAS